MAKRRHEDSEAQAHEALVDGADAGGQDATPQPLISSATRDAKRRKTDDASVSVVARERKETLESLNRTLVDALTKRLKEDASADVSAVVQEYLRRIEELRSHTGDPSRKKQKTEKDTDESAPPPLTFTFRPPQKAPFEFGAPHASPSGFTFGAAASTSSGASQPSTTNSFGAPPSPPTAIFGAPPSSTPFAFGSSSSPLTPIPRPPPSPFGGSPPASPVTGFSFGASTAPTSPPTSFGQPASSFGAAQAFRPSSDTSFGAPQSPSGFAFGAPALSPPSPFGAARPASPAFTFGSSAATKPSTPPTAPVSEGASGFSFGAPSKPTKPTFTGFMAAPNTTFGVWNETDLLNHRVQDKDIKPVKLISSGGFGDVWLSEFQGRQVAVKRLATADQTKATSVVFAAEIKVMMALKHAKITAFVGVEWTKEWEAQALSEFERLGDLRSLLDSPDAGTIGWADFKCQAAIDVADALAYLEARSPKVVMEVLRAHNVLVCDMEGSCKLSVFAAARSRSVTENLTSRMATAPWLAPEIILDTASKSERSIVYSFGALLCELDTARPPLEDATNPDGSPMSSFKLTQLVSLGKLKPAPSDECPASIAALITQCLEFDPQLRPSAVSIAYRLREIRKGEL